MNKKLLGTGMLSWPNYERITSRYGKIALFREADEDAGETGMQGITWIVDVNTLINQRGSFLAMLEGQEYDLGTGTFFVEPDYGIAYIGLKPDEPREEDWLNVDNLYKVDFQLSGYKNIDLYFVQE